MHNVSTGFHRRDRVNSRSLPLDRAGNPVDRDPAWMRLIAGATATTRRIADGTRGRALREYLTWVVWGAR
jgi:hypothetical protein